MEDLRRISLSQLNLIYKKAFLSTKPSNFLKTCSAAWKAPENDIMNRYKARNLHVIKNPLLKTNAFFDKSKLRDW
jgi:hypothetical protein